ncbi:SDR family NAD(P)-dependent oxidoreductase [Caballeronia sp. GAWG1-5s-s]|uniref:SDR family NAD(P)-dependent oxidoreductase n=1 Tax=Caballeronia sp. GAWG1-5s-s TaxID=2921743 RepID=UPI0020277F02|nr:SDR family NAD(P)-dependent oxidoreductase [Caballeronia sp. GAWG1-5s-s]
MKSSNKVLIIGASRGLGFALAQEWLSRNWNVVATVRSGNTPLHRIKQAFPGQIRVEQMDVTESSDIEALADRLPVHEFDVLYVNAGIALGPEDRADEVTTEDFSRLMVTNALSPIRIIERLYDKVKEQGTIAVMSSSLGSVTLNESGGWEVYRASKAALNMLMRSFAVRHASASQSLALVDPGWVRTDMGGADATLSIDESIPGIVDQIAASSGKAGLHYYNYRGETLPW